ncbi:MAG: hypothetical protein LAP21_25700 [Acidobacteriia bacterium]|nr:hypothetical protein [Terriglobia bacterium]
MALNSFFDLPKWQSPGLDPDAADLVGAELQRAWQNATRIVIAGDGQVEFREEVLLSIVRSRNFDLSLEPDDSGRPPQLSNTIEVKCPNSKCATNQTVVIALFPYGFEWFSASRFKPGRYVGRGHNAKANEAARELIRKLQTADDPQAVLEAAEFDPFESDDESLTARFLPAFERTPSGHVTLRNRVKGGGSSPITEAKLSKVNKAPAWVTVPAIDAVSAMFNHFVHPAHSLPPEPILKLLGIPEKGRGSVLRVPPHWLWGLCENFDLCREQLRNSERAQEWLENPERSLSNAGPHVRRPAYALKDEAAEFFEFMAKPVLESSIIKALAGMPLKMPVFWRDGSRRLAIDLAEDIFHSSMLNLSRRLGSTPQIDPIPTEHGPEAAQPSSFTPEQEFDAWAVVDDHEETWREKLARVPLNEEQRKVLFDAVRAKLNSGRESKIIEACGMVAAASATMTIPSELVTLLNGILDDPPGDLVARSAAYALKTIKGYRKPN